MAINSVLIGTVRYEAAKIMMIWALLRKDSRSLPRPYIFWNPQGSCRVSRPSKRTAAKNARTQNMSWQQLKVLAQNITRGGFI